MKLKEFLGILNKVEDKENCDVMFWYNGGALELEHIGQFSFARDVTVIFRDLKESDNEIDIFEVYSIKKLISRIRKRKKIPIIGDYVLASRWSDIDPKDPWAIGFVEEIKDGKFKIDGKFFRCAKIIKSGEGETILNIFPDLEFN